MSLQYEAFSLQKKDNSEEEYEDAYSIKKLSNSDSNLEYRFSVADGATESSFARIWAELLTEGYSEGSNIEELQKKWSEQIDSMELPWYSKEKAEQGAFAAFLGVSVTGGEESDSNRWEAMCVGDCCMFHIRANEIIDSFPLKTSAEFDNSPALLCSKAMPKQSVPEFVTHKGNWLKGDSILLMTDAIASWFLNRIENKIDSIEMVFNLTSQEQFQELVSTERDAKDENDVPLLKNDDVTIVKIRF